MSVLRDILFLVVSWICICGCSKNRCHEFSRGVAAYSLTKSDSTDDDELAQVKVNIRAIWDSGLMQANGRSYRRLILAGIVSNDEDSAIAIPTIPNCRNFSEPRMYIWAYNRRVQAYMCIHNVGGFDYGENNFLLPKASRLFSLYVGDDIIDSLKIAKDKTVSEILRQIRLTCHGSDEVKYKMIFELQDTLRLSVGNKEYYSIVPNDNFRVIKRKTKRR